ncbi:MAG: helix-turn-helix transcriptional regulator [Phycisphaerae bacterium]|nr:helix-turn-helix transcriptional regulator [Phycisphaerae bacterium]
MASPCQHPSTPLKASRRRAAIDRLLSPELFRAFGDPTRASIVACLIKCGRACSVTEVAEACRVDFSVVARHLRGLAAAGLAEVSKQGRTVSYRVRCDELCQRLRDIVAAVEEWCPNMPPSAECSCCCAMSTPKPASTKVHRAGNASSKRPTRKKTTR